MSVKQEFIRGLGGITLKHRGCVATIGSFDGVHRGHKAILTRLRAVGAELGLPTLVIIFEPQPFEFFARDRAPARLMRLREKVSAILGRGIDRVLCLKFDQALRSLSASDFVKEILVAKLGIRHLEIGDDFRFGCDRLGDFELLQRMGRSHGFRVCDTETLKVGIGRVSSTRVREALEGDFLEQAEALLGEPFAIVGRVIYGRQLGRRIDIPTANVGLGRYRSPVEGVYAVEVTLFDRPQQRFTGVANVGVRPTVAGVGKPVLEVHIFDFDEDIYGACMRVVFRRKLREERKFESVDALKSQIQRDIGEARSYFAHMSDT